ncbi:toll/interleukin-1 receptor domain-containing protein [Streptomyces sp. HUAS 31]|uniref:toll/interleukin-1 receptor domain-containing protein n=1 Tax=Streptomyces TaxID=1883 RepID=UPI00230512DC|nr:toll/interleukin-1 receptor domain-containing protein [Streptomyces sp. HUAS 31]WCE00387.1 toll/interleukin-1 receptor domain-containing protein [Streptomyces sp. HUAS 31]
MASIFISHSSRNDPLAEKVRKSVARTLRCAGHTVEVDRDSLREGQEWCPALFRMMAECDAALVLLGRAALDSAWVRKEASILMWRRALNPSLYVLPVLVGEVDSGMLKDKGFDDLRPLLAARTPYVRVEADDEQRERHDEDYVASLTAAVTAQFSDVPDLSGLSDPMRAWLRAIAEYLKQVKDPRALLEFGIDIGIDPADRHQLETQHGACQYVAHHLLGPVPRDQLPDAVDRLAPYLADNPLRRLVVQLVPTWIDGEAARRLLPSPVLASKHVVALNAHAADIAVQYVDRAMCLQFSRYNQREVGALPTGEHTVDELFALCVEPVRQVSRNPRWLPPERYRAHAKDYLHCLFLDVQGLRPALAGELVSRLHEAFPWLLVVLLTGDTAADGLNGHVGKLSVLPALTVDEEIRVHQLTEDLTELPDRHIGARR